MGEALIIRRACGAPKPLYVFSAEDYESTSSTKFTLNYPAGTMGNYLELGKVYRLVARVRNMSYTAGSGTSSGGTYTVDVFIHLKSDGNIQYLCGTATGFLIKNDGTATASYGSASVGYSSGWIRFEQASSKFTNAVFDFAAIYEPAEISQPGES